MANKTLADIRTAALQIANYESSDFVTPEEVNNRINEAVSAYYDLVLSSRETYFQTPFDFTLAGGIGGNTVALPTDLYKIQGLDYNPNTSSVQVVTTLPSFRERHNVGRRCYDWAQGSLTVYPPTSSAGNYQLFYTPLPPVLAESLTTTVAYTDTPIASSPGDDNVDAASKTFSFEVGFFNADYAGGWLNISGAANPENNGNFRITQAYPDVASTQLVCGGDTFVDETFGVDVVATVYLPPLDRVYVGPGSNWIFANADFTLTEVGSTITVAGSAESDGTYTITSIDSATSISCEEQTPGDEAFLPGVTVTYQPAGTVHELPTTLQSGSLWIELFVAASILDKAEQDSSAVQVRLANQTKRIQDAFRWKQDEPKQVPLVRRRPNGPGWGW